MGPNPNHIYPNKNIKQIVYIKNVITRSNIVVGEYTYYDDVNGAEKFEDHVTHHYEFLGDKLIIGKFCAIAKGIEFVMNGANHRIPGPILSIVKLLSSTPIFNNKEQVNELSLKVSKLFNGTLLAEKDANGKIIKGADGKPLIHQMDLRGELGVMHQLAKQALPVIVNEAFVRGFYFINRLIGEIKDKQSLKDVDWDKTIPFGNRTIERMMTIATGTFTAIDTLDAVIEGAISGAKAGPGFWAEFGRQVVLRLNFVGIGRFTIALGTDAFMGLRRGKKSRERMLLKAESLYLLEAKMYYGDQLMWTAVKDARQSVDSLFEAMQKLSTQITEDMKAAQGSIREIENVDISAIDANNKGLTAELLDNL